MKNEKLHADAVNEPKFSAENLAEELYALLGEYFVGKFERNGNEIKCGFLNGQTFTVKVESNDE